MLVHVSERQTFLSPNCCNFALECNGNSKKSENVRNLGFFGKKDVFLEKKEIFQHLLMWPTLSKERIKRFYSLKMSFHFNCGFFSAKNQNFSKVEDF